MQPDNSIFRECRDHEFPVGKDYETYLRQLDCNQLQSLLLVVERRLGTAAERTDDLDRARMIAHQIANMLTWIRLKRELG